MHVWNIADLITGYFGLWTVCKDLSSGRSFCGLNVTAFHLTSNFHFWRLFPFISYFLLNFDQVDYQVVFEVDNIIPAFFFPLKQYLLLLAIGAISISTFWITLSYFNPIWLSNNEKWINKPTKLTNCNVLIVPQKKNKKKPKRGRS